MTRGQRFTFLGIAAVIAAVAVILLAGGGDETDRSADATPTATATATARTARRPPRRRPRPRDPKPPPLLQAGKVKALTYDQGETVRFRVRSDEAEEVHIHGYDIEKELAPNKTVTVSFKATITGIFEIELEGSATQLASLKVFRRPPLALPPRHAALDHVPHGRSAVALQQARADGGALAGCADDRDRRGRRRAPRARPRRSW